MIGRRKTLGDKISATIRAEFVGLVQVLEETLEEVLAEVRGAVVEVGQALRDEYKEPDFDTAEEQNAHVRKMIEVLGAVAEGYDPGRATAVSARHLPELPSPETR